jgi:hypothetical protein
MPLALELSLSTSRGSRDKVGRKEGILEQTTKGIPRVEKSLVSSFRGAIFVDIHIVPILTHNLVASLTRSLASIHIACYLHVIRRCGRCRTVLQREPPQVSEVWAVGGCLDAYTGAKPNCSNLNATMPITLAGCVFPPLAKWLLPTPLALEGARLGSAGGVRMASGIPAAATLSRGSKLASRLLGEPDPEHRTAKEIGQDSVPGTDSHPHLS